MLFNLFIISALLLGLLTGTAATACDGKDKSWTDIGDDNAIDNAFSHVCSDMLGKGKTTSEQFGGCVDVGENHIDASIDVNEKFDSLDLMCAELLSELKTSCVKGGTMVFDVLGSAGIHGNISAYPEANNCEAED